MASYSVAAAERGAYGKTLVASTVDTVTFADDRARIEVVSDGTAAIYFTVNGTTPTVGGAATYEIPAGSAAVREVAVDFGSRDQAGGSVVKLISSGTPKYSVAEASS